MPSTSTAPDEAQKKSFGIRCAEFLLNRKIIIPEDLFETARLIDFERSEVIRRAAGVTIPREPGQSMEMVKTTTEGHPIVDGKKFGNRKKIPPTPEQVTAYGAAIGYPLDGQDFCDSYEAKGWKVGKNRMKDWQATVRNWRSNAWGKLLAPKRDAGPKDYSKF